MPASGISDKQAEGLDFVKDFGIARGAVFGDALAALFEKFGYDVTREYYINDAGAQVDALGRSAYLRYREALGITHLVATLRTTGVGANRTRASLEELSAFAK